MPGLTTTELDAMFSDHAPSGRQTAAKRKYVEGRRFGEWRRGIEPPSEGRNRGIPAWSGVAKRAESRGWRPWLAPGVTSDFPWTWNVSGTCGRVAHRVRASLRCYGRAACW
jgi:hypothetical protein